MSYDLNKAKSLFSGKTDEVKMVPVTEVVSNTAPDTMQSILDCIDAHLNNFKDRFYIEVILRSEETLDKMVNESNASNASPQRHFRTQIIPHQGCPSPIPDHTVFQYTKADGKLDLLWTLPPEEWCDHLKRNAQYVDKEEWHLLSFVLQYYSGKLMQLAKKLNGERVDSVALDSGSKLDGAQTVVLSNKGDK